MNRRRWYYSVGIELETFVEADYPDSAHDCIHDVLHRLLDSIDCHHFPRVVCNLVANVTSWNMEPMLCSLGRLDKKKNRVVWPGIRTRMVIGPKQKRAAYRN